MTSERKALLKDFALAVVFTVGVLAAFVAIDAVAEQFATWCCAHPWGK